GVGVRSWLDRVRGRAPGRASRDAPEFVLPAPPTEQDIRASLARVDAMLRYVNSPPVVTSRVARIARSIDVTLPRLRNLGLGSADASSVVATATDYLPAAGRGH